MSSELLSEQKSRKTNSKYTVHVCGKHFIRTHT